MTNTENTLKEFFDYLGLKFDESILIKVNGWKKLN